MTSNQFSESLMIPASTNTLLERLSIQPLQSSTSTYSRMKSVRMAGACLVILILCTPGSAQSLSAHYADSTWNYRLDGRELHFDFHDASPTGSGDNSGDIDVSELDLNAAEVGEVGGSPGLYTTNLMCKGQTSCVQIHHSGGIRLDNESSPSDISQPYIDLNCNSQETCVDFLNAMKNALAPKRETPNAPQAPVTQSLVSSAIPASAPQPAAQAQVPADTELHDLLSSIGWLSTNGGAPTGKSALDNLVQNIKPGQDPAPNPPQNVTYAAFSQAGGFDANGSWGIGTATDLNSAVGQAENTCHQGAQGVCDDEGYCMLRQGLWGAWASDLKVAGNTAFACNLPSADAARQQAQAWCGDGCKVLWTGAAQ